MAADSNLVLQASTTQTASFNGTGVDLRVGTPRRGLKARVLTTAISGTSPTVAYKVQHSDDNATFSDLAMALEGQVTAVGQVFIPFETSKRYVRLVATIGGTTPSVTYAGDILLSRP
jgi:hypothetical protein